MEDHRNLDALRRGDADAFWLLWQEHSRRLYAICLREMRGNHADAEDAVATVMMKALVNLPPQAARIVSVKAWLIRVTRNVCNDIHRQRAREVRAIVQLQTLQESQSHPEQDIEPPDPLRDPSSLFDRLPPRLRVPLVLRSVERMSYNEIAAQLSISCSAARKRVQHARAALRELLLAPAETISIAGAQQPPPERVDGTRNTAPHRARQQITTLRAYVRRHPTGWKMHLKLAELLYATGAWTEAAEYYRHVLAKRPAIAVALTRLQRISPIIEGIDPELEKFTSAKSRVLSARPIHNDFEIDKCS